MSDLVSLISNLKIGATAVHLLPPKALRPQLPGSCGDQGRDGVERRDDSMISAGAIGTSGMINIVGQFW